jgi:APA family basic amino acid/polyamine antiporter
VSPMPPAPNVSAADAQLVRAIGVRQLTASIINVTIGSGIFLLPALVAKGLGPAAPIAYLACAALMTLIVFCFASAGSRVSRSGGLYAYIDAAFGGYVGFIGGVLYCLTACLSVASVATGFAGSVGELWAPAAAGPGRAAVLLALFAGLAFVNVRGVKPGARVVEGMTVAKLLPLLLLLAVGVWAVHPTYLSMTMPAGSQVGDAAIVLIFAFIGIEIALAPSGEVRDTARTVPRAAVLALVITTTLYLAIQGVAQGVLGPDLALDRFATAPLAETAGRLMGRAGRLLLLVGATVSMFGYVSGDMLGTPRALFAFGRDGVLPASLARVHPRFHTPYVAIVIYAAVVAALAISGTFIRLVVYSNIAALSMYFLCIAASYELQRRDVRMAGVPFALPGGWILPLMAGAGIVWLLWRATMDEYRFDAIVVAVATAYYVIKRRAGRPHASRS